MNPSHDYKKQVVREYAERYNCRTLVETGTYLGEMVEAMIPHFDRIISIELGEDLYRNAVHKFAHEPKVQLIHGDSGHLMKDIMPTLEGNVLFWLDGHYSEGITARGDEDCPVLKELFHIFSQRWFIEGVVLIDDARLFDGDKWPKLSDVYTPEEGDVLEYDIIRIIL